MAIGNEGPRPNFNVPSGPFRGWSFQWADNFWVSPQGVRSFDLPLRYQMFREPWFQQFSDLYQQEYNSPVNATTYTPGQWTGQGEGTGPYAGWRYDFDTSEWVNSADPKQRKTLAQAMPEMRQQPWWQEFAQLYEMYYGTAISDSGGGDYGGYNPGGIVSKESTGEKSVPPPPPVTGGGGAWPPPESQWTRSPWLTDAQKATLAKQGKTEADYWRPPNNVQNKFQNWLFDRQTGKVLTTSGQMRDWSSISPEHKQELQQQWWFQSAPPVYGSPGYQQPTQPAGGQQPLLDGGGTAPTAPPPQDRGQPYNPWTPPPSDYPVDPWAQGYDPWGGGASEMPYDMSGGGYDPYGGMYAQPYQQQQYQQPATMQRQANPWMEQQYFNPYALSSGILPRDGGFPPTTKVDYGFPSPAEYWEPDPWSVNLQATNVWGWPMGYGPMTQPGTGTQPPGGYGGYDPYGDFNPGDGGSKKGVAATSYGGNTFAGQGAQGAQQAYTPNDDGAWEVLGNLNLFPNKEAWNDLSTEDKLSWINSVFPYVDAAAQNKLANAKLINENNLNRYDRLFNQTTTQWQQKAAKAEFDRDTAQMGADEAYRKWTAMGYEIDEDGNPYNPTLDYQKFVADQWANLTNAQLQSGAMRGLAPIYDSTGQVTSWEPTREVGQQNLQHYLSQLASRGLAATIDPQTGLPTSETMNLAGQKQKSDIRNLQASMYGQDLGLNAEGQLNKPDFMNTQNYREWFAGQFGYDPGMYGTSIGGGTGGGGGGTEGFARTGTEPDGTPTQQLTLPAQQQQWMQNFQTQNAANDWLAQQAGLTGMFNGAPTQSMQQQSWNQVMDRAGLMGYMQEAPAGGGPPEMNPTQSMQQQLWAQNTQFPQQLAAQKEQAAWASFGRQFAPNPKWM